MDSFIKNHVRTCYWEHDLNCATTTLKILSDHFDIPLASQVLDAAVGMHGAGGHRAQCGIVEGTLMFIGILGRAGSVPDDDIVSCCKVFAQAFEAEFGSLSCRVLRPEGFHPDNPPHLCEDLTVRGIAHSIAFIDSRIEKRPGR